MALMKAHFSTAMGFPVRKFFLLPEKQQYLTIALIIYAEHSLLNKL